jgi:hypothetical protein
MVDYDIRDSRAEKSLKWCSIAPTFMQHKATEFMERLEHLLHVTYARWNIDHYFTVFIFAVYLNRPVFHAHSHKYIFRITPPS